MDGFDQKAGAAAARGNDPDSRRWACRDFNGLSCPATHY